MTPTHLARLAVAFALLTLVGVAAERAAAVKARSGAGDGAGVVPGRVLTGRAGGYPLIASLG